MHINVDQFEIIQGGKAEIDMSDQISRTEAGSVIQACRDVVMVTKTTRYEVWMRQPCIVLWEKRWRSCLCLSGLSFCFGAGMVESEQGIMERQAPRSE